MLDGPSGETPPQVSQKTLNQPHKSSVLNEMTKKNFWGKNQSELEARNRVAKGLRHMRKRVSNSIFVEERREKIKEMELRKEAEEISMEDSLTGLKNRRYFFGNEQDPHSHGEMRRLFLEAQRSGNVLSVIILDGDNFKMVNDTFGHKEGDKRLRGIANIIKSTARESDIVGKYGGEEFIVVLQSTDVEQTKILAERINKNIRDAKLPNTRETTQTISAGVAFFDPKVGSDIVDEKVLIDQADKALYKAKNTGKNKVVVYNKDGFQQDEIESSK